MFNVRRALVSVSDKRGLIPFVTGLAELGVEVLSTGGTCRQLREAGLDVIEVSEKTGFPEIMDGRVKTLHPVIHGGLLGRRGTDEAVMHEHGIEPIDLLVVNLYPFEATIARTDATIDDALMCVHFCRSETQFVCEMVAACDDAAQDVAHFGLVVDQPEQRFAPCAVLTYT